MYLIPLLLFVWFGYWMGGGAQPPREKKLSARTPISSLEPSKSFVIVLYAYKDALWCERTLRSIFEQEYDQCRVVVFEDGSHDGTLEKIKSFVVENKQDHRVILIQNAERLGPVACLHRAAHSLSEQEIVIPISAKDWFASPKALNRLNALYRNPDVWTVALQPLLYPTYEEVKAGEVMKLPHHIPVSFYAGLLKRVHPSSFDCHHQLVLERDAYLKPILQMSGEHFQVLKEPLFIVNLSTRCYTNYRK